MLLLPLFVSHAVHAADCNIDRILQNPKSPCTREFVKKIPDEQDRAEFKFRLSRWKRPANLLVYNDHGFIEAQVDGKSVARAIWLKYQNPAILWLNGKILIDKSGNPSLARALDNMFRPPATAMNFIPEAFAGENDDLVKNAVFFYSINDRLTDLQTAGDVVHAKTPMGRFLPPSNPLVSLLGGPTVTCATRDTVEAKLVHMNPAQGGEMEVLVTPLSPTEFKLTGIEKGKTHLVTLTSFTMRLDKREKTFLHPEFSLNGAMIAECMDKECKTTAKLMPYSERELIFGRSPEKEKAAEAARSPVEKREARLINEERRARLGAKMFGMSIMGNCCANETCRQEMKNNYNVNLTPASASGAATH
jgi:hypothetical protein